MLTWFWMYAGRRNQHIKMKKNLPGKHVIRYPTILKIRGIVQLKDDIPKENHPGNTAEMTVIFQQKEVKANRTIQIFLVVDTIILENRSR